MYFFFLFASVGDVAGIVFLPIRFAFGEFASFLRRTLPTRLVISSCRVVQCSRFPLSGSGHPCIQPDLRPQPLGGLSPALKPNKILQTIQEYNKKDNLEETMRKEFFFFPFFLFLFLSLLLNFFFFCNIRQVLYK